MAHSPHPAEASTPPAHAALELLRAMRPHQWVKNLFVLTPLVFAKLLLDTRALVLTAAAFGVCCLITGAVYLANDLADRERDKLHPVKRFRPIASGRLSLRAAKGGLGFVLVAGFSSAALVSLPLAGVMLAYFVLNLAYSFRLKRVPFVDISCISIGFLLRILAGAVTIGVPVTGWLYLCTFLLASYLALGKRRHELVHSGANASQQRSVLAAYTASGLDRGLVFCAISTMLSYAAYTISAHAIAQFGSNHLVFTLPFIVFGLLRFGALLRRSDVDASPTDAMIRDVPFLINLLLWGAAVLYVVYK